MSNAFRAVLRRGLAVTATVLPLALGSMAAAHGDDPKARAVWTPYPGPGWTEASGELAGVDFPAQAATLRSWLTLSDFGGFASGNDCWGYVSPSGREYALMGLNSATAFVDITNPGDPQIVDVISGPNSLWRDVKVYQDHAYVVTEGTGAGIQVIDMSSIDAGTVTLVNTVGGPGGSSTHNVAIDTDSGFLYRCGGGFGGLRIYDLSNPAVPVSVGQWTTKYVHDLQVVTYDSGPFAGRQIAYLCGGFNGGWVESGLTVLDVTDKSSITTLDEFVYPNSAYSHQAWLSEDRQYLYLNDELDERDFGIATTYHIFNVSDPSDIQYVGARTNGNIAVGHNIYVDGTRMFAANYRSGVRFYDLSDPENPVEQGFFDTYPSDDQPEFDGAWSVYPFFPSGNMIISDIERGLFVVTPDPVGDNVVVSYPGGRPDILDPSAESITVSLAPTAPGLLDDASVRLVSQASSNGAVVTPMTNAGGDDWSATFPAFACGEAVAWYIEIETEEGDVFRSPIGAPVDAWTGYAALGEALVYEDDAETDAGWSVTNENLISGEWERGTPVDDGSDGDPTVDFDGSGQCWLTENNPGNSDVDGGPTRLTSAAFDTTEMLNPQIRYAYWFSNDDQDDPFTVLVSDDDGATWTTVEVAAPVLSWIDSGFFVADYVELTDRVRVRFEVADQPNNSLTEAGVDALRIVDLDCGSTVVGDVDGDGVVGFSDLIAVLSSYGPCPVGEPCAADVDGSGTVDFQDLLTVLGAWS